MNGVAWDCPRTHLLLAGLTLRRARFRIARVLKRLRSPRRLIATTLAIAFFVLYLLNGIFVFSNRAPADPDRLRLWLSGGMVLYTLYHVVRCVWSTKVAELELSEAERLWLGGGPIRRSTLAVYHLNNIVVASLLKSLLLVVLLARDVAHPSLLLLGILVSLVLLETVRLIIERGVAGLEGKRSRLMRGMSAIVAGGIAVHLLLQVAAQTPPDSPGWLYVMNGFRAVGETAASEPIQALALPWQPAAGLAINEQFSWMTALQLVASLSLVPLGVIFLVHVDLWTGRQRERGEREQLRSGQWRARKLRPESVGSRASDQVSAWLIERLPSDWAGAGALVARQFANIRRYAGTVVFSFSIPMLLSLSPLVTGRVGQPWFFVVGGIAMCTLLLAPPALRIDFRRDLKRMLLLRSLPIKPIPMAVGQLLLPITITITFQVITIGVAAWWIGPDASQVLLWVGLLSALAVFTFALENAFFLAYPHHERTEGVAMMVRAKLTFLGKMVLIVLALGTLLLWANFCQRSLPEVWATSAFVSGALVCTWTMAIMGVAAVAWCWARFDVGQDIPPE